MKINIGFSVDEEKVGTAMRMIWELGGDVFACTNGEPLNHRLPPPKSKLKVAPAKRTTRKRRRRTKAAMQADAGSMRQLLLSEIRSKKEISRAELMDAAREAGFKTWNLAKDLRILVDGKYAKRTGRGVYVPGTNKAELVGA